MIGLVSLIDMDEEVLMLKSSTFQKKIEPYGVDVVYFSILGLYPEGFQLNVNKQLRTLSLMINGDTIPKIIQQQQLTKSEMCILLPMLNIFPRTCYYEILLSSMLSSTVDLVSIECWLRHLEDARNCGMWRQVLKPLNRTVSSLRPKLHMLDLDIVSIRGLGYSITRCAP